MVEWKNMWEVTTWDKKFSGVDKSMQPKVIKYHYFLANELCDLESVNGDIRILYTTNKEAYTNSTDVEGKIAEGEVVTIPWGGNVNIQYYNGKFVTADNRIATSNDRSYLNNKFLYYWMLSQKGEIEKMYRGAGIKHPSMLSVLSMVIPIPSLSEQERIVGILDTFTAAIENLKEQIAQRRKQYEYYRDQLLTFDKVGEARFDVKWMKLGDIVTVIPAPMKLEKRQYLSHGIIPIIDQGQKFIIGYTNEMKALIQKEEYVIFGDHTREIKYVDFAFAQGADGVKILKPAKEVNCRFLYQTMKNLDIVSRGYNRHWTLVKDMIIPIPPLSEQHRIVSILDRFEALTTDLQSGLPAEIEARRKQYEYYREKLLTFKRKAS